MISEDKYLEAKKIVEKYEQEQLNIPVVSHRFHIILENGEAVLNVQKLNKRSEITEKTKLYYELGYKRNIELGVDGGNWIRTGKFKEITDTVKFREGDDRLEDPKYIAHHNFVFNGG